MVIRPGADLTKDHILAMRKKVARDAGPVMADRATAYADYFPQFVKKGVHAELLGRVALDEAEIFDFVTHRAAQNPMQRLASGLADGVLGLAVDPFADLEGAFGSAARDRDRPTAGTVCRRRWTPC